MTDVIIFGFCNPPLEMFFNDYLKAAICRYQPGSLKTYTSRLTGQITPMNWVVAFDTIGINTTQMDVYDLVAAKTLMKNACRETETEFAHIDTALNVAFTWGIKKNIIPLTESDLSVVKQNRKSPAKIELAPELVIEILRTKRLGKTDFLHLRNYCLVVISLIHVGARTGKEILGQKESHLISDDIYATIIRENGDKESLPYRRSHIKLLVQLVEMNKAIRKRYHGAGSVPCEGMDDLFINPEPRKRNGVLTWAMSNNDIQKIIEECSETYGFAYIAPSVFRRNSCVYGQIAAMCVGFHESYVSNIKGHSNITEETNYSRIMGSEIEFINRTPKENIDLHERIYSHSIHEWLEKPYESRHLACALTSLQSLGRFEMREKLTRYRAGELDLDRFPQRPIWAAGLMPNARTIGARFIAALLCSIFRWFSK
jgi:hypothetical protein